MNGPISRLAPRSDRQGRLWRVCTLALLLLALLVPAPMLAQAEPEEPTIVAFPGNFGQAIGLPSWAPDDAGVAGSDEDGDGIHTLTVTLPRGSYEFKVALNGTWDENFGLNGEFDGANIPFDVPEESEVVFAFNTATGAIGLTVAGQAVIVNGAPVSAATPPSAVGDGQFNHDALLHASRSDLFRTPFGAQPFDTEVTLRLRTAANDAEQALLLVDTLSTESSFSLPMARVGSDGAYDWWQVVLNTGSAAVVHNYKFQLIDGGASLYYADDSTAGQWLGGTGEARDSRPAADAGWDLYVYHPDFEVPAWAQDAIIYQIFPDRFRNGDPSNDPQNGDFGYPSERGESFAIAPWNTIVPDPDPFDPANPWSATWNSTFYGGDLQGVLDKLDYLQELGVNTIYFTPINEARTNHRYDAVDYRQVDDTLAVRDDPAASQAFFAEFAAAVEAHGMRLILDAVPNHTSSDSPMFDLYGRHPELGACEDVASEWRDYYRWLEPRPAGTGVCAGDMNYHAFAGVSTLPQADTTSELVIDNWLGEDGITNLWLDYPAVEGWRVDTVPELTSVNDKFFELWRPVMKEAHPDALLVAEAWPEASVRERLLGEEFDTTMNYRFAFSTLAFVRGTPFAETTDPYLPPLDAAEYDDALRALQEDYPPQAFAAAMNLLSSHDIQRAVRALDTEGVNQATLEPVNNFEDGRTRLTLAAVLQFTLPGAPTVFYGDEVGLTGFGIDPTRDDPHNRQPFPWEDAEGYDALPSWRQADAELLQHYRTLGALRTQHSFLRAGDWTTLVAEGGLYVYLRKDETGAAIVAINRGSEAESVALNLTGHIPFGALLENPFEADSELGVGEDGSFSFDVGAAGFSVWVTAEGVEMAAPAAPTLVAEAGGGVVTLRAEGAADGQLVTIYRSPVDGGYELLGEFPASADAQLDDVSVTNGQSYWYVATVRDELGRSSARSAPVSAMPAVPIEAATLGGPLAMTHTISALTSTLPISGIVTLAEATENAAGALRAELGLLPEGAADYTWTPGAFVGTLEGGAVYTATLRPRAVGSAIYRWRFSTNQGASWTESDPGTLSVLPSDDTEAPKPPFRMDAVATTAQYVAFAWRISRPRDLYNFRICRADLTAGETGCALEVEVPKASNVYTDTQVTTGHTYSYTVNVVDTSFNVSAPSDPITLTAQLSLAEVTFRMRVPPGTPPGDTIYIAGDNPDVFGVAFSPALLPLSPVGDGIWEITLPVKDGETLQYKYTRGSWETVEQWGTIAGFTNRKITVVRSPDGTALIDNTSTDWGGDTPDDLLAPQLWRDPLVTATEPAADSTGPVEAVRAAISVPAAAQEGAAVIEVVDAGGAAVAGSVAMEGAQAWLWTPNAPLAPGAYTATVSGLEATAVMAAPYTWSFTVE